MLYTDTLEMIVLGASSSNRHTRIGKTVQKKKEKRKKQICIYIRHKSKSAAVAYPGREEKKKSYDMI